jgi:hypothetical protein
MLLDASCLLGVQDVAKAGDGNAAATISDVASRMALVLGNMLLPS